MSEYMNKTHYSSALRGTVMPPRLVTVAALSGLDGNLLQQLLRQRST